MRRAARSDANQPEIVDALRKAGASVYSAVSVGHGFPDIVIGFRGVNYLVECKSARGRLTKHQRIFLDDWNGQFAIVRSVEEALKVIGAV